MSQANTPPDSGWNEKLRDGTAVQVRAITKQDAELELEFLQHLSPEFRTLRFVGLVEDPSPTVAHELTDLDPDKAMGFLALVSEQGRHQQIGAAHFHVNAKGDSCDCSVTVAERWQKRGVGSLLMRRLVEAARVRGIRHMRATAPVQSDNSQHLASRMGFQRCQDPNDPATMIYDLELQ